MHNHDIIVIGASAGGIETLKTLVGHLPADLPAALFVTIHFPANTTSVLPSLLSRVGPLPAAHAKNGEGIKSGGFYVATPDFHLILNRGRIHIGRGPKENHSRPAIDVLFRSAALAYGPRVIGVILSGTLGDGTAGMLAVQKGGGITIVQDPADAMFPDMPRNAMQYVAIDYVVPLVEMTSLLVNLANEPALEEGPDMSNNTEKETKIAEFNLAAIEDEGRPGEPAVFACPDCGGTLWEIQDSDLLRFRCRVGHAFSSESLLSAQKDGLEGALWAALRALEENATLTRRLASRAHEKNLELSAASFEKRTRTTEHHAHLIRQVLLNSSGAALAEEEKGEREYTGHRSLETEPRP